MATPSFSWSDLVLGSIACSMTGAGKSIDSSTTGLAGSDERLTGGGVLQTHHGDDLTGADRLAISSRLFACIW